MNSKNDNYKYLTIAICLLCLAFAVCFTIGFTRNLTNIPYWDSWFCVWLYEQFFNGNYKVSGLNIWIGHQKTEDLFYKNARPTVIRIIGSDGSNEVYTLQDTMGMQRVKFKHPITANNIKLVVEKVAPGTKYEDTCIAEVSFF